MRGMEPRLTETSDVHPEQTFETAKAECVGLLCRGNVGRWVHQAEVLSQRGAAGHHVSGPLQEVSAAMRCLQLMSLRCLQQMH